MRCCTPSVSAPARAICRSPPRTPRTRSRSCTPRSLSLPVRARPRPARARSARSARSTRPCWCTGRRPSPCTVRFRSRQAPPHRTVWWPCTTRARPPLCSSRPRSSCSRASHCGPLVRRCSSAAKADGAATAAPRGRRTSRRPIRPPITRSPCTPRPIRPSCTGCRATATRCTPTRRSPPWAGSIAPSCMACARTASRGEPCWGRCATTRCRSSTTSRVASRHRSCPAMR